VMWESAKAGQADRESDAAAVESVRRGDREAFRILVQKYQDVLYRTAVQRVGSPDVAADLVQATFIKAYTSIWRCRDPERFGAWIYRILVNGTKDHQKSKRRRDISLSDDTAQPVLQLRSARDPERDLDRSSTKERLNRALATLPELMREAFLLKHVEGMSYEEIAALLHVSVPALKMRVHRARSLLHEALKGDE
jgi:RNA polymerase sigma-70 factor (ECF subfamily)